MGRISSDELSIGLVPSPPGRGRGGERCKTLGLAIIAVWMASCADQPKKHPATNPTGQLQAAIVDAPAQRKQDNVVIVGAGISGLAAALELGRGGADVTVVDMSSVFGGHAVMSQGSLSIAGSPVQERQGDKDTPDIAYKDFLEWGEDADAEWVRFYVDNSMPMIYDWVTELGVRFEGAYQAPGNTFPREHQPIGRGIGLVTPIFRACQDHPNIRFVWNTKVTQLIQADGKVAGVIGRNVRTDEETRLEADAVILATGGFQNNLDMVREFWPAEFKFPEKIYIGSGRHSVGFGHMLAQEAGGELARMDHQWNYFCGIPDPRFPGSNRGLNAANMFGILVNAEGKQFANLHGWAKIVMPPMLKHEQQTCWFIFDEASKPQFHVSGSDWADFKKVEREIINNPSLVTKADTLEELAEKAGLPKENLIATVNRWNELVEQGVDDDFGRFGPHANAYSNGASPKIGKAPFYAMQTWPLTRKSMGGVAIDRECRVVDKKQKPIPGLYAVGELTGLAGINGKAALEGTFLGPCIVTGRVAGQSILKSQAIQPLASTAQRCADCHDIVEDVKQSRPGYWHFEAVHKTILERSLDCRQCHAELSPYDETEHKIHLPSLTASCLNCHTGRE